MAHDKNTDLVHDFPPGIGNPATQALIAAGMTRLAQLTKLTEDQLLQIHGVGPKAVGILRSTLDATGRSFAEPNFPPGIGKPATRALIAAGYTSLDQLTKISEAELLQLHGMGPKALGILRSALDATGRSFARPTQPGT